MLRSISVASLARRLMLDCFQQSEVHLHLKKLSFFQVLAFPLFLARASIVAASLARVQARPKRLKAAYQSQT